MLLHTRRRGGGGGVPACLANYMNNYCTVQQLELLTLIPWGRQYNVQNNSMSIEKLLVQKIEKIYNPKAYYPFQKVASGIFFEKFILYMASR
jgi:hypothetical protein